MTDTINAYNQNGKTISIYLNNENNVASICINGISCKKYTVPSNILSVFFGSGTVSTGTVLFKSTSSFNATYKSNAFLATK